LSLHVLVISDNESFAAYLCELLTSAGHTATSVSEAKQAYRAIRQTTPHLIIVAVEAAKVPALAVEHRVHSLDGSKKIPIIVISECLRLEAELLQVFDFIPKPLDVKRLLDDVAAVSRRLASNEIAAAMTDQQYLDFSGHILACSGLHFESRNRPALERGVDKRMSALRMTCCSEYLAYLKRHGTDRHELQKLLQFLTVGETYFFRYPSHFSALRERLAARYTFSADPIRIWSAGCSTGEEPYSIAISIMEALPDWRERDIKVIATDINNRSLKRAREGVYTPWSMRIAEQHHKQRYFDQVGDSFLIRSQVKQLVEFSHLNLSSPDGAPVCDQLKELDAVFCRNVLIYFPSEPAAQMVARFAAALKSSGQLFLGHAETLIHRCPTLEIRRQESSFYYVKKALRQRGGQEAPVAGGAKAAQSAPELDQTAKTAPAPRAAVSFQATPHSQLGAAGPAEEGTHPAAPPAAPQQSPAVKTLPLSPAPSPRPGAQAPGEPGTPGRAQRKAPRQAPAPAGAPHPGGLEPAAVRLEAARQLYDQEDFQAAEQVLETLVDCPEEPQALILRGFILAGKGHFQEALDLCSRAIELNDLLPEAYFLKGVVLDANDRLQEAAQEYRKALLLDHDFIMPRFHMGRLHLRLGRVPEAAREIRNSIRILSRRGEEGTIPYSGGLTRAVCMVQLQNALAQVA